VGTRRKAREHALQILYQLEASTDPGPPEAVGEDLIQRGPMLKGVSEDRAREALALFADNFEAQDKAQRFIEKIVVGVAAHADRINTIIGSHSPNWRLDRMAMVDRNVLRIATWELLEDDEVPSKVVIDEAIEIARRFGSDRSAAFVNGVLDAIARDVRGDMGQG
jgi:N utilization substance protein B